MNVFGEFLDKRDDENRPARDGAREELVWLNRGVTPEARLISFDTWARKRLDEKLDWAWAGTGKERRIEQCRLYLETVVLELWKRGWMIDGRRLGNRIEELLDAVAAYQKAGKVQSFWPYFTASVDRYVGANAEELQAEAMRLGSTIQQLLGPLGITGRSKEPTMPELIAQRVDEITKAKGEDSLRAKTARERARQAACKEDAQQLGLFR